MSVKERIKEFINHKGISQRKFESLSGLSNGYVNNISNSVSPTKLEGIMKAFPEVNPGWLLSGYGEMLLLDELEDGKRYSELVLTPPKDVGWSEEQLNEHLKKRDEVLKKHDLRIKEASERINYHEHTMNQAIEELSLDQLIYLIQRKHNRRVIACPFVNSYIHESYIQEINSPEYRKKLPKHIVLIDEFIFQEYIAFEIKQNERETESINSSIQKDPAPFLAGDIVTGRKVDHLHPNFWFDVHKYRGMIAVTKSKIMTFITTSEAIKEGLRTFKFESLLLKQTGLTMRQDDILEVFEIVHLGRYY